MKNIVLSTSFDMETVTVILQLVIKSLTVDGIVSLKDSVFQSGAQLTHIQCKELLDLSIKGGNGDLFEVLHSRVEGDVTTGGHRGIGNFVHFIDVAIDGNLDMRRTHFLSGLTIRESTIGKNALFNNSQVADGLTIQDTHFYGHVDFSYSEDANSKSPIFPTTHISSTEQGKQRTVFERTVSFDGRNITGPTEFKNVLFKGAVSIVHGSLHPDTSFENLTFFDHRRGNSVRDCFRKKADTFSQSDYRDMEVGFGSFRSALEKTYARHDQYLFHALEMECRRKQTRTSSGERYFGWFYKKISNYGQSIGLPIRALFGEIIGFGLVYYLFAAFYKWVPFFKGTLDILPSLSELARLSITQMIRPFSYWLPSSNQNSDHWLTTINSSSLYVPMGIVAGVQSALSIATVTLLVFSIRRRFQIT